MFDNDIVSVIIPVYNAEKFIGATIESVLAQKYPFIEIVMVDDCSRDLSQQVISQYMNKHQNIIYHRQENNCGAAVARNTALQIAKGRYVAFLDSDDLWYHEKVNEQLAFMAETKAAICFTAIEMINEEGRLLKGKRKVRECIDYKFLLQNTMIATSSVIVDRKMVGNFQMPLIRSGQDYATWLQLMRNGTKAYGIDRALVKYRVGHHSLSSNKLKSIQQVWSIQVNQEGIDTIAASSHTIKFVINALKKYFFLF